jgi:hypothetical protein
MALDPASMTRHVDYLHRADCAAFSYRTTKNSNKNSTTVVAYFKGTTSLFFMDANFHFEGQVQNGWLSQIKHEYATPPGAWRSAPCAGTICPPHSTPCHEACMSIAPCCSDRGPPGEALERDHSARASRAPMDPTTPRQTTPMRKSLSRRFA